MGMRAARNLIITEYFFLIQSGDLRVQIMAGEFEKTRRDQASGEFVWKCNSCHTEILAKTKPRSHRCTNSTFSTPTSRNVRVPTPLSTVASSVSRNSSPVMQPPGINVTPVPSQFVHPPGPYSVPAPTLHYTPFAPSPNLRNQDVNYLHLQNQLEQ